MTVTFQQILDKLDNVDPDVFLPLADEPRWKHAVKFPWLPNGGPQHDARVCDADELLYGGEAGGGKSDLLLGLALTEHRRSLILRRQNKEVEGLVDRSEEILGHRNGYNSQSKIWRLPDHRIMQLGGCQHLDDRKNYQGVPKDFVGFDELAYFLEAQYTFIIAWARSTVPGQRVRVVGATNPPVTPEGMWIVKRWGPWLDPNHPSPALPGELRYFTTYKGEDYEVSGPGAVVIDGEPLLDQKGKPIYPKSRTFIPAELADNPDLDETGYAATLASLPGGMREAMMEGDFSIGQQDAAFQAIPSSWVDAAMARWTPEGEKKPMDVLAVDIAQGGKDQTVLSARHGEWFARLQKHKGVDTKNGPAVAALIFMAMRDGPEVVLDMGGGYGQSTYDHLTSQDYRPTAYSGSAAASARDRSGVFGFTNMRSQAIWMLREALDPVYGSNLSLPPDNDLRGQLCAATFKAVPRSRLQVESKVDVIKRIGRSTDDADAIVMAHWATGVDRPRSRGQKTGRMDQVAVTSRSPSQRRKR